MMFKRVFHNATDMITGRWREVVRPIGGSGHSGGDVPVIKTGFSQLDRAIGIGGLPQGCITELISPDKGGGISIAAGIAAKWQRKQFPVTIFDVTGCFEVTHAARCGLVAPDLLRRTPHNVFELVHLTEAAARQAGLIVLNLGFIPDTFEGMTSSTLAALLRRLRQIAKSSQGVFLYITFLENVDPFIHTNYCPGFQLNEVAEVRLWVQDEGWIKKDGKIGGYRGNVTVIKNNLGVNGKGANIRIPFVDPEMMRLVDELGF